jgi:excisionase family DNA binding protein
MRLIKNKGEDKQTITPRATLAPGAPRYLTVAEVAALLQFKVGTIYQMVHQKRIPFRRAGRQLRFDASEIDAWTKTGTDNQ